MSLAVAEALIDAGDGDRDALMSSMAARFVSWYCSDDNNRSPGAATGATCEALRDGAAWRDAGVKDSKGCGANMRVAPIGLFYDHLDDVADVARDCARITHGHACGTEGAAAAALAVALAVRGAAPAEIHAVIARHISGRALELEALWSRIPHLLERSPREVLVDLNQNPAGLGEGWVAEEAVCSAMYCFWRHPDDARASLIEAANTDGDSDSIACIAGGIVGARQGSCATSRTAPDSFPAWRLHQDGGLKQGLSTVGVVGAQDVAHDARRLARARRRATSSWPASMPAARSRGHRRPRHAEPVVDAVRQIGSDM